MPETSPQSTVRKRPRSGRRSRWVPLGAETIPRFAPSDSALGAAFAAELLEELRKELEGIDLTALQPKKRARRSKS